MIYARRALQRRLNELRDVLGNDAIDGLAGRLNRAGKDRTAAMWEVIVLHALSKCGSLRNEIPLASGRRPDVALKSEALELIADITAVSDEGLDDNNPYYELSALIERAKTKLKLPIGGLDLRVRSKHDRTPRGTRTILLLPPRGKLQEFVSRKVVPLLREQMAMGCSPWQITIDDDDVGLDITIDPTKSPHSSGSFAAYDVPKIKDRNPLYNALKAKAEQLRGADGLTGVIVGDGDCTALAERLGSWDEVSSGEIVGEFFRQFSSVDFVVLLSVRETRRSWGAIPPSERENLATLFVRDGCSAKPELARLFDEMVKAFPRPAMMPVNGALRACEPGYDLGHHGGFKMSGRDSVRIGLREFTEIFAGLRTLDDNGAKNVEAARRLGGAPSPVRSLILRNLTEGRLPIAIEVIKTDEDDNDDWVEIRFGSPDPAISPLR